MDDLKFIKKYYGEEMMHLCRDSFSTILEEKGKLSELMDTTFVHSKKIYKDISKNHLIEKFKEFMLNKYKNQNEELVSTNKNPFELMKEAGYTLYECNNEEDILNFKKYYIEDEELCTFRGNRLEVCYVFFAVKEGADKLDRSKFTNPERQDEYGTSVISIQFSRNDYNLSIKNRYNHTVHNPDATYSNNLENIIPGLTDSFEKYLNHSINYNKNDKFEIPGYTVFNGKYYEYNYEIHNIYYCPNNIIIDNDRMVEYEKEKYILADYYTINLKDKVIYLYDAEIDDGFIKIYKDIEKIYVKNDNDKKIVTIVTKDGEESKIIISKDINQIIGYENNNIKELEYGFMYHCYDLENINLPNLEVIDNFCFTECRSIENLYFPKVREIGSSCFKHTYDMKKIDMPNLISVDNYSFSYCNHLEEVILPNLEKISYECFNNCNSLENLYLPKLKEMGSSSFRDTKLLQKIYLPELIELDSYCFVESDSLEIIDIPKLKELGNNCFERVYKLKEINMPSLEKMCGENFRHGGNIEKIYLPELKTMRYNCFNYFEEIGYLDLPKLEVITEFCFACCDIKRINVPYLRVDVNAKINKTIRRQNFRLMPKRLVDKFKKLLRGEEKGKCKIYK